MTDELLPGRPANGRLKVTTGASSDRGHKPVNQDFHGGLVPHGHALTMKGVAFAIADGIGSSDVSQEASETAVKSFLADYYCTPDAWSVRHSGERVISAINAWLWDQTRKSPYRDSPDRGYACTFSAMVMKATIAHLFHIGDTRIYRIRDQAAEQLTHDHTLWVSRQEQYLSRVLGVESAIEIDYRATDLRPGDTFILSSDGVHDHLETTAIIQALADPAIPLDQVARRITETALENGSDDNLTVQIIRIDELPEPGSEADRSPTGNLPPPPIPAAGDKLDGYTIVRELHASSRSHVFLARAPDSGEAVVLKIPSLDLREEPGYLERLITEEWIARRVTSNHIVSAAGSPKARSYLYTVTGYIEGQTLAQWMNDNPSPSLEEVRNLTEQIARGLQALHRMDILHQDLRPENVIIDQNGTAKLIDFGAARVAGIAETQLPHADTPMPGTALYMAPEYFLGESGSAASDLYSLAVITYHMLSGRFPYGTGVAKAHTIAAQRRLSYQTVMDPQRPVPAWIDHTLRRALQTDPDKRYPALSEFIHDLRHPNPAYLNRERPPLLERNPVLFWQGVSGFLAVALLYALLR
ncbi:MAG: bifunctional protein-serine/threonine kinase/phosphatase [Pseudomonadota bacterium]|nr:bifunctional protein-serine/threonine kinase/phosphatase [Pseudomonadota bacterium]